MGGRHFRGLNPSGKDFSQHDCSIFANIMHSMVENNDQQRHTVAK